MKVVRLPEKDVLGAAFSDSPVAILVHGSDGRILDCNRSAEKLLGWPRGQILQRSFLDFVPERLRKKGAQRWREAFRTGRITVGPYETTAITPIGEKRLTMRLFTVFQDGLPAGMQAIAKEVGAVSDDSIWNFPAHKMQKILELVLKLNTIRNALERGVVNTAECISSKNGNHPIDTLATGLMALSAWSEELQATLTELIQ